MKTEPNLNIFQCFDTTVSSDIRYYKLCYMHRECYIFIRKIFSILYMYKLILTYITNINYKNV